MSDISGQRSLHRLIYASRQRVPAEDLEHEVSRIIRASIRNNRLVSVTGLLLVHGGWFLQALEGPAGHVMTTYGRILNDPRHAQARLIQAGPADTRAFGDWNMCARGMNPGDEAILRTLAQRESLDPEKLEGAAALRLLTAVRGIQERTQLRAMI